MILRRISGHLREQNWVTVDFLEYIESRDFDQSSDGRDFPQVNYFAHDLENDPIIISPARRSSNPNRRDSLGSE